MDWMRFSVGLWVGLASGCGTDSAAGSPAPTSSQAGDESGTSGQSAGTGDDGRQTGSDAGGLDTGTTGPGPIPIPILACGDAPAGAVGAAYAFTPTVAGADGPYDWEISELPPGMTFNPLDGSLSGVPEQEGTYDFELTVSAGNGQSASESCTVDVGPAMTIALEDLGGPCIGPEDDLAALIVGGDGSPPTCSTPGGTGAGSRPEGVEVDPETCTIAGTSSDTYGTWVWVTAVEQSGYRQYVPYCYRQDTPAEGAYTVSGVHGEGTLGALDPAVATFTPGEPLDWGGGGDPLFSVEGPCGPTTCYFGFVFQVSSSGFGGCDTPPCYGLGPTEVINPRGAPIGYTHNLFAKGPPVPEDLQDRPWVLNWELRYCLASDPVTCNGSENIVENGEGALRFGVIMQPAR